MVKITFRKNKPLSLALIQSHLEPYGIKVTPELAEAIQAYTQLLLLWNQKINLSSVTNPSEILRRHFGESMFAAHAVPVRGGRLADVGSGAGFPGLALKLACPALEATLIEPNGKKATFLAEVCRRLELSNVDIRRGRIEEIERSEVTFDYVSSRAVGQTARLLAWASRNLTGHGQVVLWLGEKDAQRITLNPGWNWKPPIAIPLSLHRVLLVGSVYGEG